MAEYIDRERVIEFVRNYPHYDFDSLVEELYELPPADVIERSEYDKMIQAFIDREESLRQVLVDTRNSYFKLEKEYAELKAKFDKAIEDMENEVKFWKEPPKYDVPSVNNARIAKAQSYAHAIEILKGYKGD